MNIASLEFANDPINFPDLPRQEKIHRQLACHFQSSLHQGTQVACYFQRQYESKTMNLNPFLIKADIIL